MSTATNEINVAPTKAAATVASMETTTTDTLVEAAPVVVAPIASSAAIASSSAKEANPIVEKVMESTSAAAVVQSAVVQSAVVHPEPATKSVVVEMTAKEDDKDVEENEQHECKEDDSDSTKTSFQKLKNNNDHDSSSDEDEADSDGMMMISKPPKHMIRNYYPCADEEEKDDNDEEDDDAEEQDFMDIVRNGNLADFIKMNQKTEKRMANKCKSLTQADHVKIQAEISMNVEMLMSDDEAKQKKSLKWFRKRLQTSYPDRYVYGTSVNEETIATFIKIDGLVPRFANLVANNSENELQHNAGRILCKITCGGLAEHFQAVVDAGAVSSFATLLASNNEKVCEDAMNALIVITSKNYKFSHMNTKKGTLGYDPSCHIRNVLAPRSELVDAGLLDVCLTQMMSNISNGHALQKSTLLLQHLFFNAESIQKLSVLEPALKVISTLLNMDESWGHFDDQIMNNVCSTVANFMNGNDCHERIQTIIDLDMVPQLVELLLTWRDFEPPEIFPMDRDFIPLEVIGNLVLGTAAQVQVFIDCLGLPCLMSLLSSKSSKKVVTTCWIISNVCAGPTEHIQKLIDIKIFDPLIHLLISDDSSDACKQECAWAISNATNHATPQQIQYLLSRGIFPVMCNNLLLKEGNFIETCLQNIAANHFDLDAIHLDLKDCEVSSEDYHRACITLKECYVAAAVSGLAVFKRILPRCYGNLGIRNRLIEYFIGFGNVFMIQKKKKKEQEDGVQKKP